MKIQVITSERDYETNSNIVIEGEIDQRIDEYFVKSIICDDGDPVTSTKYLKIGNIVVPSYRFVGVKVLE